MSPNFNQLSLNNIPNCLMDQLYDIHFHTYERKNTGVSRGKWESNLKKDYHSLSQKQLFRFSHLGIDSFSDGYMIIAGIQIIDNKPWVKILEGAASPQGSYVTSFVAFTEMFNHFLILSKKMKWNLWGEVSLHHFGIFKFMVDFGFSPVNQLEIADSLYCSFLGKESKFKICEDEDKIRVNRPTQISPNYSGFLIGFEQDQNTNLIKQIQRHEHYR